MWRKNQADITNVSILLYEMKFRSMIREQQKGSPVTKCTVSMLISRIRLDIVYPSLKKEHARVIATECFLANFALYKDLYCSLTFQLNSSGRNTVTSRPLLEAFCKQRLENAL